MTPQSTPDVRYVVLHRPGPQWQAGVDFREQPGVMDHVRHYRTMFENGRLDMGGPYLTLDSGGMMVPIAGLSEEEIRSFAAADPAVQNGLLEFEVRPWYVAMRKSQ
jgi:uncharacterized protein YciI